MTVSPRKLCVWSQPKVRAVGVEEVDQMLSSQGDDAFLNRRVLHVFDVL